MAEDWRQRLLRFAQQDKHQDFIIECAGTAHEVNRLMISAHSRYFEKLCSEWTLENEQNRVVLKEDKSLSVRAMVNYFKTAEYAPLEARDDKDLPFVLRYDLDNFVVADKYEVLGMGGQIFEHFRFELNQADIPTLKWVLIEITEDVFDKGPSHLRFAQHITNEWVRLLRMPGSNVNISDESLTRIIASVPEFGVAIVRLATAPMDPAWVQEAVAAFLKAAEMEEEWHAQDISFKTGLDMRAIIIAADALVDLELASTTDEAYTYVWRR